MKEISLQEIEKAIGFVSYFSAFFDKDPIEMSFDQIKDIVKGDTSLKVLTERYRALRAIVDDVNRTGIERKQAKDAADKLKQKFPAVIVGAKCVGGKENKNITQLLPYAAIDIDHVASGEKMELLNQVIRSDKHVIFDAPSPSGQGHRAFLHIGGIDEMQRLWNEAATDTARLNVFRHMWSQVADYVKSHWDIEIDVCCAKPAQIYSLAYDENAYYAADAEPLAIDMSNYEPPRRGRKKTTDNAKGNGSAMSLSSMKCIAGTQSIDRAIANAKRLAAHKSIFLANGRNNYLYFIASQCNRYGANQDDLVSWAIENLEEEDFKAEEIAQCIASAYKNTDDFGVNALTESVIDTAEQILQKLGEYRYNVITGRLEVRYNPEELPVADGMTWTPVGERDLKTIYTYARRQFNVRRGDVEALLFSLDFAPEFHPLLDYLQGLKPWKPGDPDYIRDLFDHLILVNAELAPRIYPFFKLWVERMVGLGIGVISKNQLVPALVGKENTGKSYFWEMLLPPVLRNYFQPIDPSDKFDKDMDILLSQKLLANFDEHQISRRESNTFKAKVSGGTRSVRKPYAHEAEMIRQRCSMALTCNEKQYIGFHEGTRRLLSIEIKGTKNFNDYPLCYEGIYAQAYYSIQQGMVKESITQEQVTELKALNAEFMEVDACEDAILTFYEVPSVTDLGKARWLSATEIIGRINNGTNREELTPTRIGLTMIRLGFKKKKIGTMRYRVIERDPNSNVIMSSDDDYDYVDTQC